MHTPPLPLPLAQTSMATPVAWPSSGTSTSIPAPLGLGATAGGAAFGLFTRETAPDFLCAFVFAECNCVRSLPAQYNAYANQIIVCCCVRRLSLRSPQSRFDGMRTTATHTGTEEAKAEATPKSEQDYPCSDIIRHQQQPASRHQRRRCMKVRLRGHACQLEPTRASLD